MPIPKSKTLICKNKPGITAAQKLGIKYLNTKNKPILRNTKTRIKCPFKQQFVCIIIPKINANKGLNNGNLNQNTSNITK